LLALRTNIDLLEYESNPDASTHCIEEARLQIERMDRLVADLMLLGERETFLLANQEPINLPRVVRKVVSEAQRYAGPDRIALHVPGTLMVMGNELRLSQVVANLVDNALKHTPPKAAVTVKLEQAEDQARLTVSDTGPGIAAEHLRHIFRRGYRVNPGSSEGQGLGLAIVERLTEAHGGRVEASSTPGGGSIFIAWLPLLEAEPTPVSGHSRSRESDG
jgi:two-component system, OmpR family, sensor kinase